VKLGVDPRTIAKWETCPELRQEVETQQLLDVLLQQANDRVKARFALLHQAVQHTPSKPAPAPQTHERTDDDMNRRDLLRLFTMAGAVIATPALDQVVDIERLAAARRSGQVDTEVVAQYEKLNEHLWQVFMLANSKGKVYPLVQDHLSTLVDSLQRATSTATHQRLCVLTGDLFQLAGEIFFDGNRYTDAAHCYSLAASASKEAGHFDLWACAMTRHAFIGVYEREYRKAEPMLDLAASLARRGDNSLSTRQWVAVVRAETLAGLNDFDGCQRALDEAEQVLGMTGRIHNGGWLRFDGGRLPEERGTCYVTLRRPDLAEQVLTEALTPALPVRRRGNVLVDLAALGLQQGDVDQVLDYGNAAVELARQTGSGVIAQKLRGLQPQLAPLARDGRIASLNHDITTLATAS